jgi:Multiprotein bridging factor 1
VVAFGNNTKNRGSRAQLNIVAVESSRLRLNSSTNRRVIHTRPPHYIIALTVNTQLLPHKQPHHYFNHRNRIFLSPTNTLTTDTLHTSDTMGDDWDQVTKIGYKVRGGGSGGEAKQTVVRGKGSLNAALRSGTIVGTEKKFQSGNSVSH